MTEEPEVVEIKKDPMEAFASLGVSFILCAGHIKDLMEYIKDTGSKYERDKAEVVLKTLFSAPEVKEVPLTEDAMELAKQYENYVVSVEKV
jgi:hypothetical protein